MAMTDARILVDDGGIIIDHFGTVIASFSKTDLRLDALGYGYSRTDAKILNIVLDKFGLSGTARSTKNEGYHVVYNDGTIHKPSVGGINPQNERFVMTFNQFRKTSLQSFKQLV